MILYVVRHGESQANVGLAAHADSSLTGLGQEQARCVAKFLADKPIAAILSSPFRRAIETAEPLCRQLGMKAELCPLVSEWSNEFYVHMKTFVGEPLSAVLANYDCTAAPAEPVTGPWWPRWPESFEALKNRVIRAGEQLAGRFPGQEGVAVFTHGAMFAGLEAWLAGELEPLASDELTVQNAVVTIGRAGNGEKQLLCRRESSHLSSLV